MVKGAGLNWAGAAHVTRSRRGPARAPARDRRLRALGRRQDAARRRRRGARDGARRADGRAGLHRRRRGRPPAGDDRAGRGGARRRPRRSPPTAGPVPCSASCSPPRRAGAGSPASSSTGSAATCAGCAASGCRCSPAARRRAPAPRSRAPSPGHEVTFGGIAVRPGDIVFGDDDGLLIATPERIEAALEHGRGDRARRAGDPRRAGPRRGAARADQPRRARRGARPRRGQHARVPGRWLTSRTRSPAGPACAAARSSTAILAGSPPGVLSMTGGFPNPATFPTDELDAIAARLLRDDAAVAMQYTPVAGIPGVREYLLDRIAPTAGPAARRRRADRDQRRHGVHRAHVPGARRSRRRRRRRGADLPRRADGLQRRRGGVVAVEMDDDGLASTRSRSGSRPGCGRSSSTPSRSTRTRPAGRCRSTAAARSSSCAAGTAC